MGLIHNMGEPRKNRKNMVIFLDFKRAFETRQKNIISQII